MNTEIWLNQPGVRNIFEFWRVLRKTISFFKFVILKEVTFIGIKTKGKGKEASFLWLDLHISLINGRNV